MGRLGLGGHPGLTYRRLAGHIVRLQVLIGLRLLWWLVGGEVDRAREAGSRKRLV